MPRAAATPPDDTLRQRRDALLIASLVHVPFDGWSPAALRAGARDLEIAEGEIALLFPGGVRDVLSHWTDWTGRQMTAAVSQDALAEMRVRDRVAALVMARLEALAPYREAVRAALAWLAAPDRSALALRLLWRACDDVWFAAGDRSTDSNYYTKRGLLAGVLSSTVLVWLDDKSEGWETSRAFLDRRIADVLKIGGRIGKLRGRVTEMGERLDPFRALAGLRGRRDA